MGQNSTNSTTLKMMNLKLVLLGLMLVQCIMSLPYEEAQLVELPEGQLYPLNSDADLDLAQFHHRHHGWRRLPPRRWFYHCRRWLPRRRLWIWSLNQRSYN